MLSSPLIRLRAGTMLSFAGWKGNNLRKQERVSSVRRLFCVVWRARAMKIPRKAFAEALFVEPSAWAPPYQAWRDRAKDTRELAERAMNNNAKKLLLMIADSYDRLAK
jgi:hypothetical protein